MKVVSWNVNSLRARQERFLAWVDANEPDVLCLQETKVRDEEFPRGIFEERGYALEVFGQKTYNGVALASRRPMRDVWKGLPGDGPEDQKRLIAALVGDLRLINVYVPNGSEVGSEKFAYKLEWLRRLREMLDERCDPSDPIVICGDFNIAPEDRDVHDPGRWRGKVLFSEPEHEALRHLQEFGLHDLFRAFCDEGGHYTWWDYRLAAFRRGWGLRIDLFLGTTAALERCRGVRIDKEARKGEKPSDHAPVIADFVEPEEEP